MLVAPSLLFAAVARFPSPESRVVEEVDAAIVASLIRSSPKRCPEGGSMVRRGTCKCTSYGEQNGLDVETCRIPIVGTDLHPLTGILCGSFSYNS